MAHLHLNEPSFICDVWVNKVTYLLKVLVRSCQVLSMIIAWSYKILMRSSKILSKSYKILILMRSSKISSKSYQDIARSTKIERTEKIILRWTLY